MVDPSTAYHGIRFHETFGQFGFLMKARTESLRDQGSTLSPFNAFLFLQGLETLALRMARHSQNALAVAAYLAEHPAVGWVSYPGLASSTSHGLAERYLPCGQGGILAFGIRGGLAAGQAFINNLRIISHLANVGDTRSLVIHPASTTHQQMSTEDRVAAGIGDDLIRLSIGLEDVDDLVWDLDQALAVAERVAR
jgi:O-acetylhomoserine (thiol)-lyase